MIRAPSAGAPGRRNGAVAQLGERRVRNAKVRGSTPLGSTTPLFVISPGCPKSSYKVLNILKICS